MKESWEIRRASLHDVDDLASLCKAAVDPEDYVIEHLEDLVLLGVVHVALDDDRIVGMMHYSPTIDGNAWLGAARTHPRYRRRGVASALIQSFVGLAARSRVHALRLWSSASNPTGMASVKASGFREVARFSRVIRPTDKGSPVVPLPFDMDLVRDVADSAILRLCNGYVPYGRYFVALTPANVHLLASAGAFYRVAGGITVVSRHPEEDSEESIEFGLVVGDAAKVLRGIPAAAGRLGALTVASFLPHDPKLLEAARKAGFEIVPWGKEAVLFERSVEVGPTSYRKRRTFAEIAAGKREGYAALGLLAGKHDHGHTGPHEDRWNP